MEWVYDPATGEYVREGHHDDDDKRRWLWLLILALGLLFDQLSRAYADGTLTAGEWHDGARQRLREAYIAAYLLGRGGLGRMTDADYARIAALVQGQDRFLLGFLGALPGLSEAQIAVRLRQYANSVQQAYWTALDEEKSEAGLTEELWRRTADESCVDCIEFEGMGWKPIGTFPEPGSGETECLSNCKCYKAYR